MRLSLFIHHPYFFLWTPFFVIFWFFKRVWRATHVDKMNCRWQIQILARTSPIILLFVLASSLQYLRFSFAVEWILGGVCLFKSIGLHCIHANLCNKGHYLRHCRQTLFDPDVQLSVECTPLIWLQTCQIIKLSSSSPFNECFLIRTHGQLVYFYE